MSAAPVPRSTSATISTSPISPPCPLTSGCSTCRPAAKRTIVWHSFCAEPLCRSRHHRRADSNWTTAEQLYVGLDGIGEFFIAGGGHASSDTAQIGVSLNSVGELGVNGPGSRWTNASDAFVGVVGSGQLTAANGGVIDVNGLLSIGPTGTLQGNSTIEAISAGNSGVVAPGLSTSVNPDELLGKLHVDGDYTQTAAGKLDVQLSSIATFDKLEINGHATLGGKLRPCSLAASRPLWATRSGPHRYRRHHRHLHARIQWAVDRNTGSAWILVYSNTDVILKLANLPTGDYNRNGTVDAADYAAWRDTLNQAGPNLAADGDNDGMVDNDDYGVAPTSAKPPAAGRVQVLTPPCPSRRP